MTADLANGVVFLWI